MSEQREIERLSTLLNRLQDDVARLQSDIRNIGSSSTSISVAQPAARTVAHSGVTGVTANQHHTKNHASRHAPTQDDPVLLDEDDMATDSDELGVTQQSIKAFIAALKLNQIQNPDADVNWQFANKHLHITFTSPTTLSGVILELLGNTSDKDLLHLHQHTGNPTGETRLQHLEWDHENVIPVRWKNGDTAFYLYFDMIAPTANRLITYPDKDLEFAVDTVAEAIAAVEGNANTFVSGQIIDGTLIIINQGAGVDPELVSNSGLRRLQVNGAFLITESLLVEGIVVLQAGLNLTGSLNMDGSGSDDEALKFPYLTQAPATLANGMVWTEADGLHMYVDGAEKIVTGV